MQHLFVDIETYGGEDLAKSGVYRYASAPDFEVLLFAYAWDDGPVCIADLTAGPLPEELRAALLDPKVRKHAHNAGFERTCLARLLGAPMPPEQWDCTMVLAALHGLPLSLDQAAQALGLEAQKDAAGKALIRYFSHPCKPTRANGGRTRNLPEHDPERWEAFKRYCVQDVEVERQIHSTLFLDPTEMERALWILDQRINDRGVAVDEKLIRNAIACDTEQKETILSEMRGLTGLENPGSVAQLKNWLTDRGLPVNTLGKADAAALAKESTDPTIRRVMELRLKAAKTSVKKYEAMERSVCPDGRVRGLLQFYGASRTGRWAGRIVQVHNLPRNSMKTLDGARKLLRAADFDLLGLFYNNVPDVLSQLVRTAFVPSPGRRFIVSDFSAIEARVIAWLAGEQWRLDVFAGHGKIYEASASQMFGVPVESITKSSPLRQKGKIAELALGYQGAVGALIQMGALGMGLTEKELPDIVGRWRDANPNIVRLWHDTGAAAIKAVLSGREKSVRGLVHYRMQGDFLLCQLPSGRCLCYAYPEIQEEKGFKKLSCMEQDQATRKWNRTPTYGGKLVENAVQAVARDCLAVAMLRAAEAGMDIAFHVHDEIIVDAPKGRWSAGELAELMGRPILWAPGLPLRAEAFETDYYLKD